MMWHCTSGRRGGLIGAQEAAHIGGTHREQALTAQHVAQPRREAAQLVGEEVVRRNRLRAAEDQARVEMILQIGADAGHVGDHIDAMLAQQRRRTNSGKLHQLRRVERAAREDDFAGSARGVRRIALQVLDAGRALALNSTRLASACETTFRFGRRRAGLR